VENPPYRGSGFVHEACAFGVEDPEVARARHGGSLSQGRL
jgi:isoleucyl-tRNA synthetase